MESVAPLLRRRSIDDLLDDGGGTEVLELRSDLRRFNGGA
jgi:hypothetical protein